ncbi:UNVERIFIED_CONTAM: hypothetical protein FKN15_053627 [Acipenser sinensis]
MSHVLKEMLVPVECKRVQLYVRVPKTDHKYDYTEFIQAVSEKFNLPPEIHVDLKDSSAIEVDADIFDELMTSSEVSFKVFTGEQSDLSEASFCSVGSDSSSGSTVILEETIARRRNRTDSPVDSNAAGDINGLTSTGSYVQRGQKDKAASQSLFTASYVY